MCIYIVSLEFHIGPENNLWLSTSSVWKGKEKRRRRREARWVEEQDRLFPLERCNIEETYVEVRTKFTT